MSDNVSNTKEVERAELHKTIWRIANDLRGSVDGWDFKSYVLGMLFYRFRIFADIVRIVARQAELRIQIDAIVLNLEGEDA
jgi:type I restriction enzyme M protein